MKGKGLASVLALMGPIAGCGASPGPGQGSAKVSPDVYAALANAPRVAVLVVLRETEGVAGSQSTARTDAIADVQASVLADLHPGEFQLTHKWGNIGGLAGEATLSAVRTLEAHPDVELVGLPGTKYAVSAESVPLMLANEAHAAGFTGKGVVVAVLDTGIENTHPDLFDAIAAEACFCTGCQCPNGGSSQTGPGSARDDSGHGTNVSGIINSPGRVSPVGVAPDTSIVAIKVLGPNGGGDQGILSGLDAVLANPSVKVVNMSLGGGRFSTVCDSADASNALFGRALATLRSRGTVTFVASGNNAFTDAVTSPACINAAVAVGAVYDSNVGGIRWAVCPDATTAANQVTCFSNSSPLVELLAPGALITSSGVGGGTSTEGGTSQATPHASGAAAVLLEANPGLSADAIVSVLKETGVAVNDPRNGLTLPRINLKAALDRVR
jgi:subtilisin family serine protease